MGKLLTKGTSQLFASDFLILQGLRGTKRRD